MHLVLHIAGRPPVELDKALVRIGSDPGCEVYLPHPELAPVHALLHADAQALWLEPAAAEDGHPVHVNGRRIAAAALLAAGDDIHLGTQALRVQSRAAPDGARADAGRPLNFAGRVVLRVLSGAETGRAYPLVNSLCLGRSALSEIRIDDPALAERQVLVQRQGNAILVKNLSPVLEMRVDGRVCTEALLPPGSQLAIEQHRFRLEAPQPDLAPQAADAPVAEPLAAAAQPAPPPMPAPRLFTRAQWLLLASAAAVSGLLILLLTYSP